MEVINVANLEGVRSKPFQDWSRNLSVLSEAHYSKRILFHHLETFAKIMWGREYTLKALDRLPRSGVARGTSLPRSSIRYKLKPLISVNAQVIETAKG